MPNRWIEHIKKIRSANPHLTYKECLVEGKKTYVKSKPAPKKLKRPELKRSDPKPIARRKKMKNVSRVEMKGGMLFEKYLNSRTKKFQKYLDKNKNKVIIGMQVCRTPLSKGIKTAINALTKGGLKRSQLNRGYEDIFHLYGVLKYQDGSEILIERNATLQVKKVKSRKNAQCKFVHVTPMSFGEMILKAERKDPKLYFYDSHTHNCQVLLMLLLDILNADSPEMKAFVLQNVDSAFQSKSFKKFANTVTSIGSIFSRLFTGGAHKECKCHG